MLAYLRYLGVKELEYLVALAFAELDATQEGGKGAFARREMCAGQGEFRAWTFAREVPGLGLGGQGQASGEAGGDGEGLEQEMA